MRHRWIRFALRENGIYSSGVGWLSNFHYSGALRDVLGSALLLILLSPVFGIIAAAVKVTSRGPVLFQQKRIIGEHRVPFTFLKFRSTYLNSDFSQH